MAAPRHRAPDPVRLAVIGHPGYALRGHANTTTPSTNSKKLPGSGTTDAPAMAPVKLIIAVVRSPVSTSRSPSVSPSTQLRPVPPAPVKAMIAEVKSPVSTSVSRSLLPRMAIFPSTALARWPRSSRLGALREFRWR